MKNYVLALSLLSVVFVSACIQTGGNCRDIQQPYLEEQCTEDVQGTSCQDKNLAYTVTPDKTTDCSSVVGYTCGEETTTCKLNIENKDTTSGNWLFSMTMVLNGNPINKGQQTINVTAGSTGTLIWSQTHAVGATVDCQYTTDKIPTKRVCEVCQNVTKYRTVQICD